MCGFIIKHHGFWCVSYERHQDASVRITNSSIESPILSSHDQPWLAGKPAIEFDDFPIKDLSFGDFPATNLHWSEMVRTCFIDFRLSNLFPANLHVLPHSPRWSLVFSRSWALPAAQASPWMGNSPVAPSLRGEFRARSVVHPLEQTPSRGAVLADAASAAAEGGSAGSLS